MKLLSGVAATFNSWTSFGVAPGDEWHGRSMVQSYLATAFDPLRSAPLLFGHLPDCRVGDARLWRSDSAMLCELSVEDEYVDLLDGRPALSISAVSTSERRVEGDPDLVVVERAQLLEVSIAEAGRDPGAGWFDPADPPPGPWDSAWGVYQAFKREAVAAIAAEARDIHAARELADLQEQVRRLRDAPPLLTAAPATLHVSRHGDRIGITGLAADGQPVAQIDLAAAASRALMRDLGRQAVWPGDGR